MNAYAWAILAALVLKFALGVVADALNLKALGSSVPPALRDVYSEEDYGKSREYLRATTRFDLIGEAFTLALTLAFWSAGGFNQLDGLVRSTSVPLVAGLLYIGVLSLGYSLLTLPFGIYGTFVIEARFGFNKTTVRTFVLDHVKGLGLALLLGAPLLAAVLALFQYVELAWLYAWAAVTAFSLALQYVAPIWIMPLFNKFTPLEAGDLREAVLQFAHSVRFSVGGIFVMDGSRRSSKSNAFFTGFGRNKRIVLLDTLIAKHSAPEIVAVVAHEVGHYKKRHILQGTVLGALHTGLMFFLLSLFLDSSGLYAAFFMSDQPIYAGLVFFALLYTPIEVVLSVAMNALSRRFEFAADRFAAQHIEEPVSLVDGLKKLSAHNLSNLTPHPFYVFLNYSHPPLLQRIRAIQGTDSVRCVTGRPEAP